MGSLNIRRLAVIVAVFAALASWSAPGGRLGAESARKSALRYTGGPDTFGYTYIDSTEQGGPDYSTEWEDIYATGTPVTFVANSFYPFDDEGAATAQIGFSFSYYGQTYSSVEISTNGFVKFGSAIDGSGSTAYSPVNMPNSAENNNVIAALWFDQFSMNAYTSTAGTAPNRRFILQWWVPASWTGTVPFQYELKLYENGDIVTVYPQGDAGTFYNYGFSFWETVGMENSGGTDGLQYMYQGDRSIPAGTAIRFSPPPPPPPPNPTGLAQYGANGTTPIFTGASTTDTTVVLRATAANPSADTRRLQIEVQPTSVGFTGTFTQEGADSTVAQLSASAANLVPGNYHWRARVFDPATGLTSNWVSFGANDNLGNPADPNGATDFQVAAPAPPSTAGGASVTFPKEEEDILPCAAGASAAPMGLLAMAGLMLLAALALRK